MKKLPIGISGLSEIITENYTYVDKTKHVYNLANRGKYYFLSRPRRFGKSLLIDTLKQAFLGNQELFKGLFLEHNWDWKIQYPVIHFDFGASSKIDSKERFFTEIHTYLDLCAKSYEVELTQQDYGAKFGELIRVLFEKYATRVVVLIDEYDKPILDNIDDSDTAKYMRDILKGLYSYIKKSDSYLKFAMLTGVSKFSKISLFSDLNNLEDITLDARYADICGYNQAELELTFQEYLKIGQVDRELLKKWYNGYNFAGDDEQKVYNPFDILLFINKGYRYQNYWFETATPTFLVRMFEKNNYFVPNLEDILISDKQLSTFDVDNIPLTNLLFQTGYLTIKEITTIGTQFAYRLTYPNLEVKASLNDSLLEIGAMVDIKNSNVAKLSQILQDNQFERLQLVFTSHFASIPHDWYRNNDIAHYEGFYASIIYSYLAALGYDLIAEDVTNQGKIDLTLKMPDKIIILEFKLAKYGSAAEAIEQIKTRNYAAKYLSESKPIHLIGISFDETTRNVAEIISENFQC